jgi:hypothetical protein
LKDIVGEPAIQFEATIGIFRSSGGDILTTRVGRYWFYERVNDKK